MKYRVLLVEDDSTIANVVCREIEKWGLEAKAAENFGDILPEFEEFAPHLVLLDISLPFYDGYHWCREIRKTSQVPVVFLSSATETLNIMMALQMGGDDFIEKPFDLSLLITKIMALLRRCYDYRPEATVLSHRGATLDTAGACLNYQGQKIELSKNEYRILQMLLMNKGSIVSREQLMERLWESNSFVDDNTLTVNITRLRKKLDAAGLPHFITTRVKMGYIIENEE